jgi:hypothetical protein
MEKKKKFVVVIFIFIMFGIFVFQRELLKTILGISLILSPFIIIIWALTHKWKKDYTPTRSDYTDEDENINNSYEMQRKVSHIEKKTTTTNTNTTVTTETIYFKEAN